MKSLNDGALDTAPPAADGGETVFNYPDPGWRAGVVTFGPQAPDTVARILTFTSAPLEDDLERQDRSSLFCMRLRATPTPTSS